MKQTFILWASALILTFLTGYIQSGISEYFPVTGTIGIDGKKVSYRFEKIFNDQGNYIFIIRTDNPDIEAELKWKHISESEYNSIKMDKVKEALTAEIPRQPAGKKILHFAEIKKDGEKYTVPDKPVELLFQGYVPPMISFLSSFALLGGLFLSYRTGLSAIGGIIENKKIKKFSLFTFAFFFVYSIAVTPLRKSFELDAINKKVVPITELYDLQSILLFLLWIAAIIFIFKTRIGKEASLVFAVATALVFLFT